MKLPVACLFALAAGWLLLAEIGSPQQTPILDSQKPHWINEVSGLGIEFPLSTTLDIGFGDYACGDATQNVEILAGTATSDVRILVTNKASSDCDALVTWTGGVGGAGTARVPKGKAMIVSCPATAEAVITKIVIWCAGGTSGSCGGTWRAL